MSTSKHINKICLAIVAGMLVLTLVFMCGEALGISAAEKTVKYQSTLFDTSYVHKIDIVMDDWDSFIETCENEEYAVCTVVVDGKKHSNIAIRAKGNTSLSTVRSLGSQRYSFKLEFDQYEKGKSLDGLDKLCLNNLIQDNTMMKDYLVYQMMSDFGVDSPLCSFAYLTVNGEDWGLYLAVEGIEDSFLSRTYGTAAGDLYKPDSMSFGGGRGNGKGFNIDDFDFDFGGSDGDSSSDSQFPIQPGGQFPGWSGSTEEGESQPSGQFPNWSGSTEQGESQPGGQFPNWSGSTEGNGSQSGNQFPTQPGGGMNFGGGGFGFGSDDVKLKYIDDDPDSYPNIFDNAKTDVSSKDEKRLIQSLKKLSTYTELDEALDMDEVMRYFVVHNFVCNGDSYTGSMIHNYYLHESDGRLSMIPWDYNLAFGTFQGGNASGTVNTSIDNPVSGGSVDDRPMLGWIFSDESYTEEYHALFAEFIEKWFSNGELEQMIADTAEMIRPYVEKDPTKFCTVEEFDKGVETMSQFVSLRAEAVSLQLAGDSTAVETGSLNLSDMGSMGGGMRSPEGSSDNEQGTRPSKDQNGEQGSEPATDQGESQQAPDQSSEPWKWTRPDQSGESQTQPSTEQSGESQTQPETEQSGEQWTMPSQDQNGGQGMPSFPGQGEGQMPSFPGGGSFDFDPSQGGFDFDPSQGWPDFQPGDQQGESSEAQSGEDQEESSSSGRDKNSGKRPSGGSGNSSSGIPDFSGGGNYQVTFWILTAVSAVVLAAGVVIAKKKF